MRRYGIKCRSCDGTGFHRWTNDDGNNTLDSCHCYRGQLVILLEPEDEVKLLAELQANVNT